jgi:hypothetical protein
LEIVTCEPAATVMVEGHTVLFMMTIVLGSELGVQVPVADGDVVVDELLPLQAITSATAAAAMVPPARILNLCMRVSPEEAR